MPLCGQHNRCCDQCTQKACAFPSDSRKHQQAYAQTQKNTQCQTAQNACNTKKHTVLNSTECMSAPHVKPIKKLKRGRKAAQEEAITYKQLKSYASNVLGTLVQRGALHSRLLRANPVSVRKGLLNLGSLLASSSSSRGRQHSFWRVLKVHRGLWEGPAFQKPGW